MSLLLLVLFVLLVVCAVLLIWQLVGVIWWGRCGDSRARRCACLCCVGSVRVRVRLWDTVLGLLLLLLLLLECVSRVRRCMWVGCTGGRRMGSVGVMRAHNPTLIWLTLRAYFGRRLQFRLALAHASA